MNKTQWLDQLDNPNPSYIPSYLSAINAQVEANSHLDIHGFRSQHKSKNILIELKNYTGCKVVILGDSFVWGSSLSIKKSWPSKLSNMIDCRIFPLGKPGWSSYEYFHLYQQHLVEIDFEYLLIGIVANDPHPKGSYLQYDFANNFYRRNSSKPFSGRLIDKYLSELTSYEYLNSVIGGYIDSNRKSTGSIESPAIISWGYNNWRQRLYQPDVYNTWVQAIEQFTKSAKHKSCFLLTPTSNTDKDKVIFKKISETFDQLKLDYLDMMPRLDNTFSNKVRPRSAWATLADAHPGDEQTTLYSNGAAELLKKCRPYN